MKICLLRNISQDVFCKKRMGTDGFMVLGVWLAIVHWSLSPTTLLYVVQLGQWKDELSTLVILQEELKYLLVTFLYLVLAARENHNNLELFSVLKPIVLNFTSLFSIQLQVNMSPIYLQFNECGFVKYLGTAHK